MKKQIFNDTATSKEILRHRKIEAIIGTSFDVMSELGGGFLESILPILPIMIDFIQPLCQRFRRESLLKLRCKDLLLNSKSSAS